MKKPRRNHSAAFKARIARNAMKGAKTITEIARENELHPMQVSAWKKEAEENMESLFERKNASDDTGKKLEVHCERLERKVGQLVVEKEFLEKKCDQLGIER